MKEIWREREYIILVVILLNYFILCDHGKDSVLDINILTRKPPNPRNAIESI